jgi:hypothetical protein
MSTKRGTPGDIDAIRQALRPRMLLSSGGTGGGQPTTIPPHTHHASEILAEPEETTALLSGDDVQEDLQELGTEKLARSGEQPMLGALDMNHFSVSNVDDLDVEGTATVAENIQMTGGVGAAILNLVRNIVMTGIGLIEQVRKIDFTGSVAGQGVIDQPRVIHMAGDHADDEAKVDGLERVVFNNEPTASSVEMASRVDLNTGVTAGSSYTAAVGRTSWDTLEDTLVLYVESGA